MHSFLGVPVTVKGRSVGNLYLTDKAGGGEFTAADQALVETFARHAGDRHRERAPARAGRSGWPIVDERERISKDLHDGIIQSIYGVGLSLEDVPELMEDDPGRGRPAGRAGDRQPPPRRSVTSATSSSACAPSSSSGTTLLVGLAAIVEEFRHNSMIDVELHGGDRSSASRPPATTAHLLGIVNEALSNVARHSGATRATVVGRRDGPTAGLVIAVTDNGRGFDPRRSATLGHQGLANMRSRAAEIGADLSFDRRRPGAGPRSASCSPTDHDGRSSR